MSFFFFLVLALTGKQECALFQDLLSVHDVVAQKDYEPKLPSMEAEDDEGEEDSVRIIQLKKSKEPLVSLSGALKYLPSSLY